MVINIGSFEAKYAPNPFALLYGRVLGMRERERERESQNIDICGGHNDCTSIVFSTWQIHRAWPAVACPSWTYGWIFIFSSPSAPLTGLSVFYKTCPFPKRLGGLHTASAMGNCCRRPAKCAHASSTHFSVQSGTLISHTLSLVFYFGIFHFAFVDELSFSFSFVDCLVLCGFSSFCIEAYGFFPLFPFNLQFGWSWDKFSSGFFFLFSEFTLYNYEYWGFTFSFFCKVSYLLWVQQVPYWGLWVVSVSPLFFFSLFIWIRVKLWL